MSIIKSLGKIDKELTTKGIAELAKNDVNQVIEARREKKEAQRRLAAEKNNAKKSQAL